MTQAKTQITKKHTAYGQLKNQVKYTRHNTRIGNSKDTGYLRDKLNLPNSTSNFERTQN